MSQTENSILLVEDDYLDIMNVERELRKLNIDLPLHVARNGREALEMLRGEGVPKISPLPQVVLLDINMPKMNGLEFLAEIRSDPEFMGLKVFIMTTSNEDTDRLASQNLRVEGYIVKPLTFDTFGTNRESALDAFSLFLDLIKMK